MKGGGGEMAKNTFELHGCLTAEIGQIWSNPKLYEIVSEMDLLIEVQKICLYISTISIGNQASEGQRLTKEQPQDLKKKTLQLDDVLSGHSSQKPHQQMLDVSDIYGERMPSKMSIQSRTDLEALIEENKDDEKVHGVPLYKAQIDDKVLLQLVGVYDLGTSAFIEVTQKTFDLKHILHKQNEFIDITMDKYIGGLKVNLCQFNIKLLLDPKQLHANQFIDLLSKPSSAEQQLIVSSEVKLKEKKKSLKTSNKRNSAHTSDSMDDYSDMSDDVEDSVPINISMMKRGQIELKSIQVVTDNQVQKLNQSKIIVQEKPKESPSSVLESKNVMKIAAESQNNQKKVKISDLHINNDEQKQVKPTVQNKESQYFELLRQREFSKTITILNSRNLNEKFIVAQQEAVKKNRTYSISIPPGVSYKLNRTVNITVNRTIDRTIDRSSIHKQSIKVSKDTCVEQKFEEIDNRNSKPIPIKLKQEYKPQINSNTNALIPDKDDQTQDNKIDKQDQVVKIQTNKQLRSKSSNKSSGHQVNQPNIELQNCSKSRVSSSLAVPQRSNSLNESIQIKQQQNSLDEVDKIQLSGKMSGLNRDITSIVGQEQENNQLTIQEVPLKTSSSKKVDTAPEQNLDDEIQETQNKFSDQEPMNQQQNQIEIKLSESKLENQMQTENNLQKEYNSLDSQEMYNKMIKEESFGSNMYQDQDVKQNTPVDPVIFQPNEKKKLCPISVMQLPECTNISKEQDKDQTIVNANQIFTSKQVSENFFEISKDEFLGDQHQDIGCFPQNKDSTILDTTQTNQILQDSKLLFNDQQSKVDFMVCQTPLWSDSPTKYNESNFGEKEKRIDTQKLRNNNMFNLIDDQACVKEDKQIEESIPQFIKDELSNSNGRNKQLIKNRAQSVNERAFGNNKIYQFNHQVPRCNSPDVQHLKDRMIILQQLRMVPKNEIKEQTSFNIVKEPYSLNKVDNTIYQQQAEQKSLIMDEVIESNHQNIQKSAIKTFDDTLQNETEAFQTKTHSIYTDKSRIFVPIQDSQFRVARCSQPSNTISTLQTLGRQSVQSNKDSKWPLLTKHNNKNTSSKFHKQRFSSQTTVPKIEFMTAFNKNEVTKDKQQGQSNIVNIGELISKQRNANLNIFSPRNQRESICLDTVNRCNFGERRSVQIGQLVHRLQINDYKFQKDIDKMRQMSFEQQFQQNQKYIPKSKRKSRVVDLRFQQKPFQQRSKQNKQDEPFKLHSNNTMNESQAINQDQSKFELKHYLNPKQPKNKKEILSPNQTETNQTKFNQTNIDIEEVLEENKQLNTNIEPINIINTDQPTPTPVESEINNQQQDACDEQEAVNNKSIIQNEIDNKADKQTIKDECCKESRRMVTDQQFETSFRDEQNQMYPQDTQSIQYKTLLVEDSLFVDPDLNQSAQQQLNQGIDQTSIVSEPKQDNFDTMYETQKQNDQVQNSQREQPICNYATKSNDSQIIDKQSIELNKETQQEQEKQDDNLLQNVKELLSDIPSQNTDQVSKAIEKTKSPRDNTISNLLKLDLSTVIEDQNKNLPLTVANTVRETKNKYLQIMEKQMKQNRIQRRNSQYQTLEKRNSIFTLKQSDNEDTKRLMTQYKTSRSAISSKIEQQYASNNIKLISSRKNSKASKKRSKQTSAAQTSRKQMSGRSKSKSKQGNGENAIEQALQKDFIAAESVIRWQIDAKTNIVQIQKQKLLDSWWQIKHVQMKSENTLKFNEALKSRIQDTKLDTYNKANEVIECYQEVHQLEKLDKKGQKTFQKLQEAVSGQKSCNSKLTLQIMKLQQQIYQEKKRKNEMEILLRAQNDQILSFKEKILQNRPADPEENEPRVSDLTDDNVPQKEDKIDSTESHTTNELAIGQRGSSTLSRGAAPVNMALSSQDRISDQPNALSSHGRISSIDQPNNIVQVDENNPFEDNKSSQDVEKQCIEQSLNDHKEVSLNLQNSPDRNRKSVETSQVKPLNFLDQSNENDELSTRDSNMLSPQKIKMQSVINVAPPEDDKMETIEESSESHY